MSKLINKIKNINDNKKYIIALVLISILQFFIITKFSYIYGSQIDWVNQHTLFPNYFRNLFYETGNLFPNFASHLGSGQNIFYLAYYGLYSPIIMFSYLLPFVPMNFYIIVTSFLIVIISIILFYYFLKQNNFSNKLSFFISLLFLFSSSFVFHSHRHIMFMNYMPFLILSLMGVKKYFDSKKSSLLIINIALMILTSYYYSVSGIIACFIYGLSLYFNKYNSFNFKHFIKEIAAFIFRIIIGILLTSILLLPVIYVILNGRNSNSITLNLSSLIPHVTLDFVMYGTYGIGLVAVFWIALIYHILFSKKEYKIVSIILMIIISFPFINYILNGGLYFNGKGFMPYLPLGLYLIASMIKLLDNNKKSWKWLILASILSSLLLIGIKNNFRYYYYYIELGLTLLLLWLYGKKKKDYILIPIIVASYLIFLFNNISDKLVSIDDYNKQYSYYSYDVSEYINKDTDSLYRYQDNISELNGLNYSYGKQDYRTTIYSSTSNPNYLNNYLSTFKNNQMYRNYFMLGQTSNLFFEKFMGVRYLLTDSNVPYGYYQIKEYENGTLYENKNTYPIGFSSNHLLNKTEYNNLSYLEQLEAYDTNIIVNGNTSNANLDFEGKKIDLNYRVTSTENITYTKTQNGYYIESKKYGKIVLDLNDKIIDSSLVIRFKLNNIPKRKDGDASITINGVSNLLSYTWRYYNGNEEFNYVVSSNKDIDKLNIEFSNGIYEIADIEVYEIPNSFFDQNNDIVPFKVDYNNTKGDKIAGEIDCLEDGYFIFTIPYDNGFTLYVDGNKTDIEIVNDMFIGFPIPEGEHNIELKFKAPYSDLGKIISIISLIGFMGIIIYEKKHSN